MDKSIWRWFPHGLIMSMLVVFVVDGWFIAWRCASFPGHAGEDGFDLSNGYDRVLARRRHSPRWAGMSRPCWTLRGASGRCI